jgi:hypothetical protein
MKIAPDWINFWYGEQYISSRVLSKRRFSGKKRMARGVRTKEETRGRGRLVLLHPESPRDPRETEDGPGSPDEIRPFSGRK